MTFTAVSDVSFFTSSLEFGVKLMGKAKSKNTFCNNEKTCELNQ